MIQIRLTPDQNRILSEAQEPVEILDVRGRVITHVQDGWTDAEVAQALILARDSGIGGTLEDLVARLEKDHP